MATAKAKRKRSKLGGVVQAALDTFYTSRLESLRKIDLSKLLRQKNPYLFRAIGINEPRKFVLALLIAYLSSSDEGTFGNAFFEPVAAGVSNRPKSITKHVDFETHRSGVTRAYAIKSGPVAFNSGSRETQINAFAECQQRLQGKAFEAVVGYGYGRRVSPPTIKKNFREVSGQAFWEELSGDPELYNKIFRLLGKKADEHISKYRKAHTAAVTKLVKQFRKEYVAADGRIDWDKILALNSGKSPSANRSRARKKRKSKIHRGI